MALCQSCHLHQHKRGRHITRSGGIPNIASAKPTVLAEEKHIFAGEVDSIDLWASRVRQLESAISKEQKKILAGIPLPDIPVTDPSNLSSPACHLLPLLCIVLRDRQQLSFVQFKKGVCAEVARLVSMSHRLLYARKRQLRRVRVCAGPASPSYFAFFSTQKDAALAAQTRIHPEDSHSFRVMEAPGPEEVLFHLYSL